MAVHKTLRSITPRVLGIPSLRIKILRILILSGSIRSSITLIVVSTTTTRLTITA
jgi:hypothetical protein